MRSLADAARIETFLRALGREARAPAAVYLTGGATAVLHGWRPTTLDVDLKLVPDSDELLRALPRLKERLAINVELASPDGFIPELSGWRDRSLTIGQYGPISIYHYDPYSQVLAKLERAHEKDLTDADAFVRAGLVDPDRLATFFAEIEPHLYRYPAIDPRTFRTAVERFVDAARR